MASIKEIEKKAMENIKSEYAREFYQMGYSSLGEAIDAYKRYLIKPRVMRDVSVRDLSTTILGYKIPFPICVSPVAKLLFAHDDGEIGVAKGAQLAGVPYTINMWTVKTPDDIVKEVPEGIKFFCIQYLHKRSVMEPLVRKAEELGCKAIMVTMDSPIHTNKTNKPISNVVADIWSHGTFKVIRGHLDIDGQQVPYHQAHARNWVDATNTWQDIKNLRKMTKLPIIAKGLLSEADAVLAVEAGVSGILVSVHGGRQMDSVISPLDALPGVVRAVNGRCEVYIDSGIRSGMDVFKALALGARAAFVGRPVVYGLAYNGPAGVTEALHVLRKELDNTMAFSGCTSIAEITAEVLVKTSQVASRI